MGRYCERKKSESVFELNFKNVFFEPPVELKALIL